jgi:hypothetical protein
MEPDLSLVHFDRALTTLSIKRTNALHVADEVFGTIPVDKQSDKYFIYGRDDWRVEDDIRRPGAEANESDWTLSSDSYYCEGHARKQIIADELRKNADQPLDPDADTTNYLTDKINLAKESLAASVATSTSVVTQYQANSGGSLWTDPVNSAPITDVVNAKAVIQPQIGQVPNRLLISYPIYLALQNNQQLIDRIKYTMAALPAEIDASLMARAFDVEKVIVAPALYVTSAPGVQEFSSAGVYNSNFTTGYVWGKNALLFYRPPAMGLRTVAFGGQFRWLFGMTRAGLESTVGWLVKRWREEKRTGDMIEVQSYYALKVVAAAAGYGFFPAG